MNFIWAALPAEVVSVAKGGRPVVRLQDLQVLWDKDGWIVDD